jgi:curved DNA-binding protein CbpA
VAARAHAGAGDLTGAAPEKDHDLSQRPFVDFYETLQLSPNVTTETLERVYRLLAKRYHPDNQLTGDAEKFSEIQQAFETLSDPQRRAQYDVRYEELRAEQWKIFDQQSAGDGREQDRRTFHGILSLLYIARRRNPRLGGLGEMTLEKMLGIPHEHLEFPLWYLKERGWIERLETGQLAITVDGVDKMSGMDLALPADRLLPETASPNAPERREGERRLVDRTSAVDPAGV